MSGNPWEVMSRFNHTVTFLGCIAKVGSERMESFVKALCMILYRWTKWGTLGYLRYREPVAGKHHLYCLTRIKAMVF